MDKNRELLSAVVRQMVLTEVTLFTNTLKVLKAEFEGEGNGYELFKHIQSVLNGFNATETYFDFNFGCLNGTLIYKDENEPINLDGYYDIWVGDFSSPIASVMVYVDADGKLKYEELYLADFNISDKECPCGTFIPIKNKFGK